MKNIVYCFIITLLLSGCESVDTKTAAISEHLWTESDKQLVISELNRTTEELKSELNNLSNEQWHFRELDDRWSISEIVEHLEIQNLLHYREISVTSKAPENLQFRSITKGKDVNFSNYSTDIRTSKSQWYLEPLGRYDSVAKGQTAFLRARLELTKLVEETAIDFRKQFTFRVPVENKALDSLKIGQVRDLHQLLLTGIAHTDRHLRQMRTLKSHENYPKQ